MKPGYTYMVNVSWLLTSQLEKGKGSITPWSVPIYGEWRNKEMWWMTVNIFRVPNSLESTTKARRDQCQLIYIRINDNIIWLNMAYGTSYIFQVQLMILNHGFSIIIPYSCWVIPKRSFQRKIPARLGWINIPLKTEV